MVTFLIVLAFALILVGALTGESFVFNVLYLILGVFFIGRWWSSRAISAVSFQRKFEQRVFPGEEVAVQLELKNRSLLPVLWLHVHDLLPAEIMPSQSFEQVISLGPHESTQLTYVLEPYRRGYYPIGPLQMVGGDLLGLARDEVHESGPAYLTVYPRVAPLTGLKLPSRSPLGTLRHKQPIFEDPTRPTGKRDYVTGDSLRRIDWKASAAVGRLQVKQFEPSIALETAIFLNLNVEDYYYRRRIDATELAIVVAASVTNWVISQKQSAGLVTNGIDPLGPEGAAQPISPRKGRGQLMRVLETLARIKASEGRSFAGLIHQYRPNLSWGTTLVVITGQADESLFDEFFQAQRAGMDIVLILCGDVPGLKEARQRAKRFGIPVYFFWSERDLTQWRK